ncbi:11672_t:CDS:2 [Dentiscutata heterogama]|uniref:11672_t:CDS:1 n=1 Tax=Dentiscutata heterogama TaxID=1316150 RepID=A0ACA9N533_9GLOM|nr:11672_t:CDS:2 [Dentiscutata heterogama]
MNLSPSLNNINTWQDCSGCEKNLLLNSFITNKKTFRTCNTCRVQNKVIKQQTKAQNQNKNSEKETIIELSDLDEYLIQIFDSYEHNKENQENNTSLKLEFSYEDMGTCDELYEHLINVTKNALSILEDQRSKKNLRWIKSVNKNFKPVEQMTSEIISYKRRRTMPRTFKDHTNNTLFYD